MAISMSYKKVAHARDPQADPCGHLSLRLLRVKQTDLPDVLLLCPRDVAHIIAQYAKYCFPSTTPFVAKHTTRYC